MPQRMGSLHPNIAPYGEWFETKDGKKLLLAVGSDRQFNDLCGLLGIENKYQDNVERVKNRKELAKELGSRIRTYSFDHLSKEINRLKIPAGVIQNVKEVFEMPEAKELLISAPGLKGVRSFVADSNFKTLSPPPHLGEHNDEILGNLL